MAQKVALLRALAAALVLSAGCQMGDGAADHGPSATAPPADALDRAILTHGGLNRWRSFSTLEFDLHKGESVEHHTVDLQSRMVRVESDEWTIGFDGANAWITPGLDAYSGSPRFYSSLQFYFFGLPFLLADPGTVREDLGIRHIDGTAYEVIKVGFEDGVGDSPDDHYLAHVNRATGSMDLLLYSVTYRSGEPTENYNARVYEWQEVQGLLAPSKMSSYRWNADESRLGEHRSDAVVTNVVFGTERPDPELFRMPEGAEIDPPPTAG